MDFFEEMDEEMVFSNPVLFFKRATGYSPYEYQKEYLLDDTRLRIDNKSRDTGFSLVMAAKALFKGVNGLPQSGSEIQIVAEQRQSDHVLDYIDNMLDELNYNRKTMKKDGSRIKKFKDNTKIQALPDNPSGVRGAHGDTFLDEAAFFKDKEKMLKAVIPFIGRGYSLWVTSTPRGQDKLFHALWTNPSFKKYKTHWSDCPDLKKIDHQASEERGETVRRIDIIKEIFGGDTDGFKQEYCNKFLDEVEAYIPYSLIDECVASHNFLRIDKRVTQNNIDRIRGKIVSYLKTCDRDIIAGGMDVAKKVNTSEIVLYSREEDGDFFTKVLISLRRTAYEEQKQLLNEAIIPYVQGGFHIDSTGVGEPIYEELKRHWGRTQVIGHDYTRERKETWSTNFMIGLENGMIKLARDRTFHTHLHSIKRKLRARGFVYKSDGTGHNGDMYWAAVTGASFLPLKGEKTQRALIL